jgi:hypothetical protein
MKTLSLALMLAASPATAQVVGEARTPPPVAQLIDPMVTSVDGMPISALPQQQLPAKGCAAFLWTRTASLALVAMATTDPASLRLAIDGKVADYPISAQNGIGGLGFSQVTEFKDHGVTATLQMTVTTDNNAPKNGSISDATLRIDRPGRDDLVVPLAGVIGCA